MIIKPKIRGFICTTTHPTGCKVNVEKQIEYVKKNGKIANGPSRVLVIGASTGYGLASRISAAFGSGAATIGVFFEKPGTETKPGSAGWYNSAAFDEAAKREGLYSKSINGDAFSDECRDAVIKLIKEDLGQIDLVVYSLASPVRKMPKTGEIVRSALKPIGEVYTSKAIDTNKDQIITASIEPATEEEVKNTVTVMGGEDWELWMGALSEAGVLAEGVKTVAYSYIGTDLTWPIYWHGALGKAKEDLDRAAGELRNQLAPLHGSANVAVQHGQTAIFAVGVLQRADAAFGAIVIQGIPTAVLRERLGGTNTRRAGAEHFFDRFVLGYGDVVLLQRLRQGQAEHVFDFAVQQAGTVQLAENAQHAARTVHVFHMVFLGTWRHW